MSLSVSEGERVSCHLCKKLFKIEDICYHVDVCEEDQRRIAEENPIPSAPPIESLACPVCHKLIEKNHLEEHVNKCLDAKPIEPNPQVEEENPFLKQQQEYLNYFARLKLNPNAPSQPNPRPEVDLQLALEIQRKEQEEREKIRKLREQDEELAKKIWEEEEEREKRRKKEEDRAKQLEWQKTVELVKKETMLESDAKMAKMLAEKEELERKLEELEQERRSNNNNAVSVIMDNLDLPEYWAIHPHGVDHLSTDVTEDDDDYHHVTSAFLRDMPNARILRIERNQNVKLW